MKKRIKMKIKILLITIVAIYWNCVVGENTSKNDQSLTKIESSNIVINSTITPDPDIETWILPYRTELSKKMDVIIGYAVKQLPKGKPEAPLNNFVADLMLKRANSMFDKQVHVAITNEGGLRMPIQEGSVTVRDIFEVMPFENCLVVLEMTGDQLISLAKEIGEIGGEPIAGMRLEFLDNKLQKITVQGESVEKKKLYFIVTTNYLSSPGRKELKILSQVPGTDLNISIRDAIIDEIKELDSIGKNVLSEIDGRIIMKKSSNK